MTIKLNVMIDVLELTLHAACVRLARGGGDQVGGNVVHKLGDRSQSKRVLDVDVVQGHVLADHQGDGEVRRSPGCREESPLLCAQPLGLAEDGEICEAQIHCSGEASQARRGRTVLANLKTQSV